MLEVWGVDVWSKPFAPQEEAEGENHLPTVLVGHSVQGGPEGECVSVFPHHCNVGIFLFAQRVRVDV